MPLIRFPYADDTLIAAAGRPNEHDHKAVRSADGDEPGFAVVHPFIQSGDDAAVEYVVGARPIQAPVPQRGFAFCRVEFETQGIFVATKL